MAKTLGGGGRTSSAKKTAVGAKALPKANINDVARALSRYSRIKYLSRGSFQEDWQASARMLIDDVAAQNYGFASDVAKTVKKYGYKISEKQSFVIASAAVRNNNRWLYVDNQLDFIFRPD